MSRDERLADAWYAGRRSVRLLAAEESTGPKFQTLCRADIISVMTKKRGYSDEFPTTREKRVYFMLDKIPPALWIRVKAKAKREGVSLRALILGWCKEWLDRP